MSDSLSKQSIDVIANVHAVGPLGRIEVRGTGKAVAVRTAGWSPVGTVAAPLLRRSREERRELVTRLRRALAVAGLELGFYIDDVEVARIARDGRTNVAARALALPGLRIRVSGFILALIRSPFVRR